jgi:hypothetical protein
MPPSVPVIISVAIYPNHTFRSSHPLPRTLLHLCNNLRVGVMWETPTWRCCFERTGQRPLTALWQNVGNGRQGRHWTAPANFRGFPPPGESRRSYTSLTTASTPCAVRTLFVSSGVYRDRTCSVCTSTNGLLMWATSIPHPHKSIQYQRFETRACECTVVSIAALQLRVTRATFSNFVASNDVHVTSWFR